MRSLRLTSALGVLAVVICLPGAALAQSTGSQQIEEEIVVTAAGTRDVGGTVVAVTVPKSRAVVTEEFLATQAPGQSILQSVNQIPGVNFVNNDPYGASGGSIRIRGFDGNRISLTQDGIPLNDTGNYAIYSSQQLDPELIEEARVNLGTTDVDSPTASATGGTINYNTRRPTDEMGLIIQPSIGSFDYKRIFGMFDTGEFTSFGTKAFVAASYTNYDKFKGPGELDKQQYNARVFQPLGDNGDFVSIIGHWNRSRNNFYRNLTLAEYRTNPDLDRDASCTRLAAGAGSQQDETNVCGNYYNLFINPSDTGNIRAQSRFTLAEGVTLTVDPSFQYVLANGGGTEVVAENDARLRGSSGAAGIDLNGDGDFLDRIRLYRPNNTNTRRVTLLSSLIWEAGDNSTFRLAYTFDRGRHRQTGEYGYLDANGDPESVFGGKRARAVETADGSILRNRDRLSIALLNQISAEYRGNFLDDLVEINVGLRAPFFKRELNQYCYTTTADVAYCSTQTEATIAPNNKVGTPFKATKKYDDILPNIGISLSPGEGHQVYASYAEGLSLPRTDDLYNRGTIGVETEKTDSFDLGYRFRSSQFIASVAGWYTKYENRLVRAFDQDLGISYTRNLGRVDLKGIDAQFGVTPTRGLDVTGFVSYTDSEIKDDIPLNATQFLPTKGKEVVDTPEWQFGGRVQYGNEWFQIGAQIKDVSGRWATDVNDERAPGYTLVDADLRINLDFTGFEGSYLQFNVINLFDEEYLGVISTRSNARALPGSSASAPQYSVGAPRTFTATLRAAF